MAKYFLLLFLLLRSLSCLSSVFPKAAAATTAVSFTIKNNCGYTVWPGILSGAGSPPLSPSGFSLPSGQSRTLSPPPSWSGRLWARTLCSNSSPDSFSCATGDCGDLLCSGGGARPPVTLAEFTLGGPTDFFDVSLVDGFNLPILVSPSSPGCSPASCPADLSALCPSSLRVPHACRSACEAFRRPEFCCTGDFALPATCRPSPYSRLFKAACPTAYSYAFDDPTSTFTCSAGADYLITFCPALPRQKAGESDPKAGGVPPINNTMVFFGLVADGGAVGKANPLGAAAVLATAIWTSFF